VERFIINTNRTESKSLYTGQLLAISVIMQSFGAAPTGSLTIVAWATEVFIEKVNTIQEIRVRMIDQALG
jgi:hypothetical protein